MAPVSEEGSLRRERLLRASAVEYLAAAGAAHVLLACTDLPIALAAAPHPACIDATEALARSCLAWWGARHDLPAAQG